MGTKTIRKIFFFLLILLFFPLISSLTLTDVSLNNSIDVDGTITLERINITNTINLYGLLSSGDFINIIGSDQNISFFGLTTPYNNIFWDNRTIIKESAIDSIITIPTARRIYVDIIEIRTVFTPVSGGISKERIIEVIPEDMLNNIRDLEFFKQATLYYLLPLISLMFMALVFLNKKRNLLATLGYKKKKK